LLLHAFAVAIAQHRFEHDANRDGQPGDFAETGLLQRGQRIERSLAAIANVEGLARIEQVVTHINSAAGKTEEAVAADGRK
jgi:hypothetical protein